MRMHSLCFYGEIRKIILEMSSVMPPYKSYALSDQNVGGRAVGRA